MWRKIFSSKSLRYPIDVFESAQQIEFHYKIFLTCFQVTQNRSFDGMDQVVSRKKMSEFGTNLSLVEDRDDRDYGSKAIRLPGSRKGDMSSRAHRPEVRVSGLKFSPTGREFTATTTEGLLVYSLDNRCLISPLH